ncbi:putative integral membrane protein [Babesia bovis T2Bo]|uniref:putative integral membrane protein n=1 Tax=Babesia bovis T2Bo TaxID=484906 RepID=UPI001C34E96A|nr:putative integral membrane protein [Babesia bovis T2Bo]KAG6440016.1 putative integral membrane protein [Babesia bovis T2Bo]
MLIWSLTTKVSQGYCLSCVVEMLLKIKYSIYSAELRLLCFILFLAAIWIRFLILPAIPILCLYDVATIVFRKSSIVCKSICLNS